MTSEALAALLNQVAAGDLAPEVAHARLKGFALADLGGVQLDLHRELRRGFPEIIYGPSKSLEELLQIAEAMARAESPLIVSRIERDSAMALCARFAGLVYDAHAQLLHSQALPREPLPVRVLVCAAGTGDLPVAHEASAMVRLRGCQVELIADCGIAGVHRLTGHKERLAAADLLIVVAGMEGALPSLITGLTAAPVIAVPTSLGYGTGLGGFAALLTMLNSCALGSVVVNIDNGLGAGYFAGLLAQVIARQRPPREATA